MQAVQLEMRKQLISTLFVSWELVAEGYQDLWTVGISSWNAWSKDPYQAWYFSGFNSF